MKKIPLLFAILLSSTDCASENTAKAESLAKSNLAESVAKYADKESECRKNMADLPAKKIQSAGLSKDELKAAIAYHYLKAFTDCSHTEAANVIVDLQILNYMKADASDSASTASQLIVSDFSKLLKLKAEYWSIAESKRLLLEDIKELQKPFDMIKAADSLGL